MFNYIGRRVDHAMVHGATIQLPVDHVYDIYQAVEDTRTRTFKDVRAGEYILVYSVGEKHLRHEGEISYHVHESMLVKDAAEEIRGNLNKLLDSVNATEEYNINKPAKEPNPI